MKRETFSHTCHVCSCTYQDTLRPDPDQLNPDVCPEHYDEFWSTYDGDEGPETDDVDDVEPTEYECGCCGATPIYNPGLCGVCTKHEGS